MPFTNHSGLQIHHREAGDPDGPPLVLIHGLMLSTKLFDRLVGHLSDFRVILVDLRGHGESSRPHEPSKYTWDQLADDVVSVLDDLGIDKAIVGGLSLGADVTLAFALRHPTRTAGMIVEMPVLSASERAARFTFGLFAVVLRAAEVPLRVVSAMAAHLPVPENPPELRALHDAVVLDPISAAATMEGLIASPVPDHDQEAVSAITVPALVVGHNLDPIHALDDARDLASHLPNSELLEVSSILELRITPVKLADAIHRVFGDERSSVIRAG